MTNSLPVMFFTVQKSTAAATSTNVNPKILKLVVEKKLHSDDVYKTMGSSLSRIARAQNPMLRFISELSMKLLLWKDS